MGTQLHNQVIIVTGAARHLGQAYAIKFAREGLRLVVCDVRDVSETAAACEAEGAEVLALQIDVTSKDD